MGLRRQSLSRSAQAAVVLVLAMSFGEPTPSQTGNRYGIQAVGPASSPNAVAFGVAEIGQSIAGRTQIPSGETRAFVQGIDGIRVLGTLGGARSVANNTSGATVVGQAQLANGQERAFMADAFASGGSLINLGTLGGTWSAAYDLRSVVVGASRTTGDTRIRAFQYQNGTMTPLGFDWGGDSVAKGVNYSGDIVGYACTAGNASCRAFLFNGGTATNLGSFGGSSVANDVNEVGQVAGSSYLANGTTQHAFLYSGGTLLDLGTFGGQSSEALGLNIHGHVVGRAQTSRGTTRAFLWRDGSKIDINTLLPPGSGWVLHAATSISDGGQIVGSGTLNGVPQAFLLSPQTDIELRVHGTFTNGSSNLPRGIQAGRTARFIYSALTYSDAGVSVHGATMTHTITGPAVFVDYRPYRESDVCELTPKVLTCKLTMLDAAGYGSEIWMNVRATAPGDITMNSLLTSPVPDPVPANNRTTEENWAVALSDLSLTPSTISGGKATSARVTLTDVAPFSDAVVQLASSRPDIAPVPDRVVVQSGSTTRAFNIVPVAVTTPTPVRISATYGQVTVTRTLTVVPTALTQLYLTPTTVIGGCGTSAGRVVLSGNAPAGGAVVQLTNTNGAAHPPATVTVAAGTSSRTFTVTTDRVTANTAGNVTASYGGVSQTLRLTVRPLRIQALTLSPNPVRGGLQVNGTVVLECAAPAGGTLVSLSSSNPVVAGPTAASVAIPAGATSGAFVIKTAGVAASTNVSIHATVHGVRKTTVLTLNP